MPNKNYINGRAYEYKAKQFLEADGWETVRTAGSHGPWDLIAIKPGEKVRCIQIKRTKAPGGVKTLLSKFQPNHRPDDTFVHEMWVWYSGKWYFSVDKDFS